MGLSQECAFRIVSCKLRAFEVSQPRFWFCPKTGAQVTIDYLVFKQKAVAGAETIKQSVIREMASSWTHLHSCSQRSAFIEVPQEDHHCIHFKLLSFGSPSVASSEAQIEFCSLGSQLDRTLIHLDKVVQVSKSHSVLDTPHLWFPQYIIVCAPLAVLKRCLGPYFFRIWLFLFPLLFARVNFKFE